MAETKMLQTFADSAAMLTELDTALSKNVQNGNLSHGGRGGGGGRKPPILKLNQDDGNWYAGIEALQIKSDDHVIIRATSARHGFVSWVNRQKTDERMVEYWLPLPKVSNDGGHVYQKQVGFDCVLESDPSFQMRYDVSSMGGQNFFQDLMGEIAGRWSHGHPHPVISLFSTTSKSGGYNTKFPAYTLVGWAADDAQTIVGPVGPDAEEPGNDNSPAPEQRPQRRTRSAA